MERRRNQRLVCNGIQAGKRDFTIGEQMEETKTLGGFSRRQFIQGAAALTATGLLAGCTPGTPTSGTTGGGVPETKIYSGACRCNCLNGCNLNIHVRDGKLVRTSAREVPNPDYKRICPKGLTQPARTYSAERIQYPMRRVGERGKGEFERISWDEALDEIVTKWQGYIDEYGPTSIAIMKFSGNQAFVSGGGFWGTGTRFGSVMGFSSISIDTDMAGNSTYVKMFGGITPCMTNNEISDFVNAKTFVCWGFNPAVSFKHSTHLIQKAKENGTRYIVIDPVYNTNASKADWWVPMNPSTDGALALGMIHEIIATGKEDTEFIRAHTEAVLLIKDDGKFLRMSDLGVAPTEGPVNAATGKPTMIDPYAVWDEAANGPVALADAQKPALTGISEVNGISVKTEWDLIKETVAAWSPEVASPICGVPVEDIRELARVYGEEGPVYTYTQFGPNHYLNGTYNYWPLVSVSVITGNIGKPGAGVGQFDIVPSHVGNIAAASKPVDSAGNPAQGVGPTYVLNSISTIIDTGKYGPKDAVLKSIYIRCGNPVCTMADHTAMDTAMKKIEFLVVSDSSMTETAYYADILLPSSHWFEHMDVMASYYGLSYFVYNDKAIEPLFESISDFELHKKLAEKMGYGSFFDFTDEEFLDLWLDTDGARSLGITSARLKEEKAVRNLPGDNYISYEGGTFLTDTKRAKFYVETVTPGYNTGQTVDESKERTLYWEPALEADKNSPIRAKYPFHVISEHMRTRTHSQWWDVEYMDDYEPNPMMRINPDDAAELGIKEGDIVRMYNDRGSVTLPATMSSGYPRGIVGSPRSFHAKEFMAGHLASLSTNLYNQCCQNQAYNDVAVAIEKV